jgi:arylsulfatase A-like enzyme
METTFRLAQVALIALLVHPAASHAQPSRPNVLLVLTDDHSAAHVGAYGNTDIKTPNLDAFAKDGMRFERAYVAAPQCVPSRAALMTGRSPVALQMTRFSAPLPMEAKTWLEVLRAAGWFTGVAGRTYHLDGSALPPESRAVFDTLQLKTFERRLEFVKVGDARHKPWRSTASSWTWRRDSKPRPAPPSKVGCRVGEANALQG